MGFGLAAFASTATVAAATLTAASLSGWTRYASATEQRIARELGGSGPFLALDYATTPAADRRALLAGDIVVEEMATLDRGGTAIGVPAAMVHHWRGAVFIPGVRLDALLAGLRQGPPAAGQQDDILDSRVLNRSADGMKIFLRLQRTKFVTVVYNTEHDVRFRQHGPDRASSSSTATRIAEVEDPGSPDERERRPGDDSGYLWRWNTYWRYEEAAGGVIAECESISLSRDVPSVVRYVAAPLIRSTASDSMTRTLVALRERHKR
jgi:hypothetical protein